jgi:hypothetical protein
LVASLTCAAVTAAGSVTKAKKSSGGGTGARDTAVPACTQPMAQMG